MRSNRPTSALQILGKEPAAKMLRSVQSAHALFQTLRPQRERFADALGLRWTGAARNRPAQADDPENFSEHAVNLSYRAIGTLKAQASGTAPVIKYPRDAGQGQAPTTVPYGMGGEVPGDEKTAEWCEILINRAVAESGAITEWRDALDDIGAWGSGVVCIGYDRDIISAELANSVSRSVEDISLQAIQGDVEAKPGERHLEAAKHLRGMVEMARDENEEGYEPSSQEVEFLLARAQSHDRMGVEEMKNPLPSPYRGDRIWARRAQVGVDVFWDSTVSRIDDASWMCRRIEMTLAQFQSNDIFKKSAQRKIKGTGRRGETGFDGHDRDRRRDVSDAEEDREKIVVLYEYWERRPELPEGGYRHFLSSELPGEFIERDNTNPYLDSDRRPLIPGFFPIYVSTPILEPTNDAVRTFGVPALAPAWAQQLEANVLRALSIAQAKRHSVRNYVYSSALKGRANKKSLAAMFEGKDGNGIQAPAGVTTAADMKALVVPIQFVGNNTEIEKQEAYNKATYREIMGTPNVGENDTLGQDEMAAAASRTQRGDLLSRVEVVFAQMCEGMRGLLKLYPIEKVTAMLGSEGAAAVEGWKASSLDGDALEVSFGSRAAAEDAVAKKQLMETIALLQQWVDPLGNTMVDLTPYYMELVRAQGLGKVRLLDPEQMQLRQMAQVGAAVIEAIGEDAVGAILNDSPQQGEGGAPSGGGSPVKSSQNDPRSPSNANIGVGARRGASTVNN